MSTHDADARPNPTDLGAAMRVARSGGTRG
jgi:hypothetical protein